MQVVFNIIDDLAKVDEEYTMFLNDSRSKNKPQNKQIPVSDR